MYNLDYDAWKMGAYDKIGPYEEDEEELLRKAEEYEEYLWHTIE